MLGAISVRQGDLGQVWENGAYRRRLYSPDPFLFALLNLKRLISDNYRTALSELRESPELALIEAMTKAILGDEQPLQVHFMKESQQQDGGVFIGGVSNISSYGQFLRATMKLIVRIEPPESDNAAVSDMIRQLHRGAICNILMAAPPEEFGRLPDSTPQYSPSPADRPLIEVTSFETASLAEYDVAIGLVATVTQL